MDNTLEVIVFVRMPEMAVNGPPPPPPPPMLKGSTMCMDLTKNKTQLLSDICAGVKLKQSKPMENGILSVNGNVSCCYSNLYDFLLIFILFKF